MLGELGVTAAVYEEAEAAVGLWGFLLRGEGAARPGSTRRRAGIPAPSST